MNDAHKSSQRGRVTAPTERPPFSDAPDYADAFEIDRDPSDQRHAEKWARDGFEGLPSKSRRSGMLAHRHLLRFRLGPSGSAEHIFGWHIARSEPDVLHLEAKGSLMEGHMIWRLKRGRLVMTTFLEYKRPRLAAAVWAFAGRIHRNSVPGLLRLAAKAAR